MRISQLLFFIMTLSCVNFSFCQKQELEERVAPSDVPKKALEWLDQVKLKQKRIKWYHEITSGKESFESKFIHSRKMYSIEFDTLGMVEDVEILIKQKNLNEDELSSIEESLNREFNKFNIVKVQLQYLPSPNSGDLLKWMNDGNDSGVLKRVELEFEAKDDSDWKMFEGTFSSDGKLLNYREILLRSTENLNY